MTELLLFPRLPGAVARSWLERLRGLSAPDLRESAAAECADAIYPATGGVRAKSSVLTGVRDELLKAAETLGFPGKHAGEVRFDWVAAPILLRSLHMHAGEACRNDVWTFIATRLLPDLTAWRFPKQNAERYLGGSRNAFQRLWWRAYLLEDSVARDPWHLIKLPEDALVGLMERPGISSNPTVSRAIAAAIQQFAASLPSPLREDGWRLVYRRIRQRALIANLDALGEPELARQLRNICESATQQVLSQVAPA